VTFFDVKQHTVSELNLWVFALLVALMQ